MQRIKPAGSAETERNWPGKGLIRKDSILTTFFVQAQHSPRNAVVSVDKSNFATGSEGTNVIPILTRTTKAALIWVWLSPAQRHPQALCRSPLRLHVAPSHAQLVPPANHRFWTRRVSKASLVLTDWMGTCQHVVLIQCCLPIYAQPRCTAGTHLQPSSCWLLVTHRDNLQRNDLADILFN